MTPDEIREAIELKVVELIKAKLTDGTMTEERSRQISRLVLEILQPGMELNQLFKAIFKLDDNCTELSHIVLPYAMQYENGVVKKATTIVESYVRHGQYDAAISLAKDTIDNNLNIRWQGSSGKTQKVVS